MSLLQRVQDTVGKFIRDSNIPNEQKAQLADELNTLFQSEKPYTTAEHTAPGSGDLSLEAHLNELHQKGYRPQDVQIFHKENNQFIVVAKAPIASP